MGMRRWARRGDVEHGGLFQRYQELLARVRLRDGSEDEEGVEEGELRKMVILHRKRERSLRNAKIIDHGLPLRCEVPRCGFDFRDRYGALGKGYAEVQRPPNEGQRKTQLEDLMIVCANCHAMIHAGGDSRDVSLLIPKRKTEHHAD